MRAGGGNELERTFIPVKTHVFAAFGVWAYFGCRLCRYALGDWPRCFVQ